MQESDSFGYERAFNRLCAGFNTPPTQVRKDAYWRSFRKLSLMEFLGLVDLALESSFAAMPTVGELRDLHRKNSPDAEPALPPPPTGGPSIQEQLCAYATLHLHGGAGPVGITLWEFYRPWTYVYREWSEGGKRQAECIGVVIEGKGKKIGFSVSAMLADREGHAKAMRSFQPGPSHRQREVAA